MSSKLKILFNFNDTEDKEPVELNQFLQDPCNQKKMYDMRCLYLIRANMEDKLTKLGIAGTEGGTGMLWATQTVRVGVWHGATWF